MRTIAILNLKGGVGKTLTAATMARCLTDDHHKNVLLIDDDPQGNLSDCFGVTDRGNSTWELLTGGGDYWPDFVTDLNPLLSIIPADMSLAYADIRRELVDLRAIDGLRQALDEDEAYDFCIIDLPPSLGLATQAALFAADEVIIPIRLDTFSTSGMAQLAWQVNEMRKLNPRIRVAGILGTQFLGTDEEKDIHAWLHMNAGMPVFRQTIRMSKPVLGSVNRHASLLTHSPRCGAAVDYRRFVREYLKGVKKRG